MDNKEDKQNNQKEKKQFKLNKTKTAEFFKRNGFYIALFICIAAAGLTAILSLTAQQPEPQQSAAITDGQQVEQVKDPTLQEELSRLNTESPTVSPTASTTGEPSSSPDATKKPSTPAFTIDAPIKGKIIKAFMIDKLTYNKTLNQWATHNGIDIQAEEGEAVKAALSGTVEALFNDQIYGGVVIITHDNKRKTVYAGVTADEKMKEGTKINAGQTLGVLKTPHFEAYLGPHLHFELIEGENNLDPSKYFK